MAPSPRRLMLRQGTADAHSALDSMIGPFTSHQAYEAYLRGMARFRLPIEDMIAQHSPIDMLQNWHPAMILNEIRADLAALGLQENVAPSPPPVPHALEEWLGVFYVLEGSSLGAKLLAKRAQSLGLTTTTGAAHLFEQAGNFSNWTAFIEVMEGVRDVDEARMIAWANATFDYAHRAFESTMNATCADC
ncbi:biliverdin-producing heme oxygenase [Rhizobium sp.]|jgi:heme oxygenase (biliverdin-IX-beta and delta-forming)|uniref:biliverdin-producing heme oxygenase n=1 Tax=Rhizobium sp. TaxID=391 RepID=UPI000E7DCADB|nr:heme oxygenase [Rhizobium sp.]